MKLTSLLLSLFLAVMVLSAGRQVTDKKQTVNPIIGDLSYLSKFGCLPDATTDNELRIRTHLEYVENLLRQKDVSGLSPELRANRSHMLDLLHEYWSAGVFPKNYDYYGQRKPCFIDNDNTICAVGYLVEQTAGRQVAEDINSIYKYDELLAMNDPTVEEWIAGSGLSSEECAMIQPTYGWQQPIYIYPSKNYISPAYGISSSILGGVNFSFAAINAVQMVNGAKCKAIPVISLFSGMGQFALGTSMFPREAMGAEGSNESKKKHFPW
jgi:hypothetical protein